MVNRDELAVLSAPSLVEPKDGAPELPEGTTARGSMSKAMVEITNRRYQSDPFWGGPKGVDYGLLVGALPIQQANLFPDQGSTYFVGSFQLPKGSSLTLHGEFPHTRYFSCTVAAQLGNGQIGNGDFLRDNQIQPRPGSHNPFLPSANRNVKHRKYTIHIVQGPPPANALDRPENTLYTTSDSADARIHLALRHYISDVGYDGTGNAKLDQENVYGLPEVILNLSDGSTLTGQAMADAVKASKAQEVGGYSAQTWLWQVRLSPDPINSPASPAPAFQRFWNTAYSVTGGFVPDPALRVRMFPPTGAGGFANNPDTIYLSAPFSLDFGRVVVIKGKMPTHQKTRHHQENWIPNTQVRYWSVSSSAAAPSGVGWASLYDEDVPVDEHGNFTLVMSWAEDRPKNAVAENGIAWLDFGGGEGHFTGARTWVNVVYFRYMTPDPSWKQSPAHIPPPTIDNPIPQDAEVMQKYYPAATYTTKAAFEALGSDAAHP